jgi:hypothetical protein
MIINHAILIQEINEKCSKKLYLVDSLVQSHAINFARQLPRELSHPLVTVRDNGLIYLDWPHISVSINGLGFATASSTSDFAEATKLIKFMEEKLTGVVTEKSAYSYWPSIEENPFEILEVANQHWLEATNGLLKIVSEPWYSNGIRTTRVFAVNTKTSCLIPLLEIIGRTGKHYPVLIFRDATRLSISGANRRLTDSGLKNAEEFKQELSVALSSGHVQSIIEELAREND